MEKKLGRKRIIKPEKQRGLSFQTINAKDQEKQKRFNNIWSMIVQENRSNTSVLRCETI
jgi:hypothetical protein